jgi:hypothetical protein
VEPAEHDETPPRKRALAVDLSLLGLVGVLLIAALAATGVILYREFYSPTAYAMRYLSLLQEHRAADALEMPGVRIDSVELDAAALPAGASDALLRQAAMGRLTDIEPLSERTEQGVTHVTIAYTAQGTPGTTTFSIAQDGWIGVVPAWRFTQSPLGVVSLTVRGSMRFAVNGFEIDKRQVAPEGMDADPLAPVSMLVFSPGIYSVTVDTAIAHSDGVLVLADAPLHNTPIDSQAEPTQEFIDVVQQEVDGFLDACATQQVLQPTGCPFGRIVANRIVAPPEWSISDYPRVQLEPDGANWRIAPAPGSAHIDVNVRSLFDGSVRELDEDVEFMLDGTISVLPDGSVSIRVGGGEHRLD